MEIGIPPPLIDISTLQAGNKECPFTMDQLHANDAVLNRRQPPDCSNYVRHENAYAAEQLHPEADSRGADEQDCVGFAYDHGEYPIIVAVHSNVKETNSSTVDSTQHRKDSQLDNYQVYTRRNYDRAPRSSQGLQHSINSRFTDNNHILRYQKDVDSNRFSANAYPQPVGAQNTGKQPPLAYQNINLESGAYLADTRIPANPNHLNTLRPPLNDRDSFHFQPTYQGGYFVNGFQASPVHGVHPAMLVPGMGDIRHARLADLGLRHFLPPAGQHNPIYGLSPALYAKGILNKIIANRLNGQADVSSLIHQKRLSNTDGCRKRTFDKVDNGIIINRQLSQTERVRLSPPPKYNFNTMDVLRCVDARLPRTRAQCSSGSPSCNDLVDAAVLSAKRYSDSNGKPLNCNKIHGNERFVIENVEDPITRQKTEVRVPCEWLYKGFFEFILRHENRYDLLQILKVAASSTRELLVYVIHKLLSRRVNENASIVLDNLKRSDLPGIVKEKVLSVVEEIIWGRSPRLELWLKRATENKHISPNRKENVVVEDENLGCNDSVQTTPGTHPCTIGEENNLLESSEDTVKKVGNSDVSREVATVSEITEQSLERSFNDKEVTAEVENKQLEVQTSASPSSTQPKAVSDVGPCQPAEYSEKSSSSPICSKEACSSTGFCNSPVAFRHSEQHCSPKESTVDKNPHEKAAQDDAVLNNLHTRDQCTQVENLQGCNGKEEDSFSDPEEHLIDLNGNNLDEDSLCHYYSIEEVTGLENTNFELLANVSVTVDSHGNTVIKKDIAEGDSIDDDRVLFDSLKIIG